MWNDAFVIPARSEAKYTAEVFLNFLLRPEIAAEIVNYNRYATANEAALTSIDAELRDDPVIFPPSAALQNAEVIMPLSPAGQALHDATWRRFAEAMGRP